MFGNSHNLTPPNAGRFTAPSDAPYMAGSAPA